MQFSDYELGFFREERKKDRILLVSLTGSFEVLTEKEYSLLHAHKLNEELYNRLLDKGIIINEENEARIVEDYKARKRQLFQGTSLHIVVPTLRCNENCIYCHAASRAIGTKGVDMDKKTARKTVDFIFETPNRAITIEFQGGEPLLNFEVVKEIVDCAIEKNKIAKKNLLFTVVTNLSLMNEEILDYLVKNRVNICTSLDGPKFLHDKNRPMPNGSSYDNTVKWIKELRARKIGVNALASITKLSLPYYREIVDEYRKLGFKKVWFRLLNNMGCAALVWKEIGFSPEEFLEFWKKGLDYVYSLKGIGENSSQIKLRKMLFKRDPLMLDLMSPCGAGIGQLAYNYDGKIYSCDEARMLQDEMFLLGSVFDNHYKDVLGSDKCCQLVAASVNECYFCDTCLYQPYCGLCPVSCYAQSSSLVPNFPTDLRCRVLKGQFEYLFDRLLFEDGFRERIMGILEGKKMEKDDE